MWTKFEEEKKILEETRMNKRVLDGIYIPDNIKFSCDLEKSIDGVDLIIIAVPAGAVNDVSKELALYYKNQHICIASKGIEQGSCLFVVDVLKKYIKTSKLAVISGGSFAVDIVKKVPVGLSLATKNKKTDFVVRKALQNHYFKLRSTRDIIGIELCGSIKNIMAIASGILDGMGYPESTSCMFITESLHDIKSLIKALGGSPKTILSFAGFGDLLLTCTSIKSRNYKFGKMIGEKTDKKVLDEYINTTTIEGLYTLKSIHKLIKNKHVSMPIINLIYDIIFNDVDPSKLLDFLMTK